MSRYVESAESQLECAGGIVSAVSRRVSLARILGERKGRKKDELFVEVDRNLSNIFGAYYT